MRAKNPLLPAAAGLGILLASAGGVLALRGAEPGALAGVALGAGLGAAGAVLEALLVVRALSMPRSHALRVVIGGFGIRLAVLACGLLLLRDGSFADPASFALSFVGGFLAGIPAVAAAASASGARRETAP